MENILSIFESGNISLESLEEIKNTTVSTIQYVKFVGIMIIGILLVFTIVRFLFGKKAQVGKAVTSAVEIFFVYVISIVIYALGLKLQAFMAPLPMVTMVEDYLVFFPVLQSDFPAICDQVLHLFIIAFLVNLLNSLIPKGKNLFTWFLLRFITVVAAIAAIYGVDLLLSTFIPQGLSEYAPMILLLVLVLLLILGTLQLQIGAVLAFLNPIVGALYTFFFNNFVGRALSKSILTALLLTGLVIALNALKIYAIPIAASALTAYIPLLLIVLGLWILLGHVFSKK